MDHLPLPAKPRHDIRVPYMNLPYDGGPFITYLERIDCSLADCINLICGGSDDLSRGAAIAQAWLFFGLLHEFWTCAGSDWDQSQFVTQETFDVPEFLGIPPLDSGRKYQLVTSRALVTMLAESKGGTHPSFSQHSHPETFHAFETCIRQAEEALAAFGKVIHARALRDGSESVGLWIRLLLSFHTLINSFMPLTGVKAIRHPDPFLSWLLEIDGWCPRQVDWLSWYCSERVAYYAFQLGPPWIGEHSKCTTGGPCKVFQVDERNYQIQHTTEECPCNLVMIPLSKLEPVISAGLIPLLGIERSSTDDRLNLAVVPYTTKRIKYVAMSHVWADGLGNPKGNGLPSCQIITINTLIRSVLEVFPGLGTDEPVYFWMDTLCIPVEPASLRKKAIASIERVFKHAAAILILDKGLRQQPVPLDPLEAVFHVGLSAWNKRLWTMQEAIANFNQFFVFKDGIVPLGSIIHPQRRYTWGIVNETHTTFITAPYKGFPRLNSFYWVWSKVSGRATSRSSDEAICLGAALGVDLRSILDIDSEDTVRRMKQLLTLLHQLPTNVAFLPGRRIWEPGWRWAIQSWMDTGPGLAAINAGVQDGMFSSSRPNAPMATITGEGLRFIAEGYHLDVNRLLQGHQDAAGPHGEREFTLLVADDKEYNVTPVREDGTPGPCFLCGSINNLTTTAMILAPSGSAASNIFMRDAILVRMNREEDDCYFCEFVAMAMVRSTFKAVGDRTATASRTSPNQQWVLG